MQNWLYLTPVIVDTGIALANSMAQVHTPPTLRYCCCDQLGSNRVTRLQLVPYVTRDSFLPQHRSFPTGESSISPPLTVITGHFVIDSAFVICYTPPVFYLGNSVST